MELYSAPYSALSDAYPGEVATAALSPAERERMSRFGTPALQRRFALTRTAVRLVLARAVGCEPAAVQLTAEAGGRPMLASPPPSPAGIDFNLAHSRDTLLIGVCRGARIGVDVETVTDGPDSAALAARYFHALEVEAFNALSPAEQVERFFQLWTLKEAILKAVGTGISGGLSTFAFDLSGAAPVLVRSDGADWSYRSFKIGDEWAAVAWRSGRAVEIRHSPWPWP